MCWGISCKENQQTQRNQLDVIWHMSSDKFPQKNDLLSPSWRNLPVTWHMSMPSMWWDSVSWTNTKESAICQLTYVIWQISPENMTYHHLPEETCLSPDMMSSDNMSLKILQHEGDGREHEWCHAPEPHQPYTAPTQGIVSWQIV